MNTNRDHITALLVSRKVKPTFQRLVILEYLLNNINHPTADKIYGDMVKKLPTLSKTTVYNTLKKLTQEGLVVQIGITGTEARFDSTLENHHHFLCEKCGAIFDVKVNCPNCELDSIHGHKIKEIQGYFKGICSNCLKSEK